MSASAQSPAQSATPVAPVPSGKILLRLGTFLRPNQSLLLLVMGLAILSGVASALGPYFISHAVNVSIPRKDINDLILTLVQIAVVMVIAVIIQIFQMYLLGDLAQRSLRRIQLAMMTKLNRMDVAFFDRHLAGDLISRVSSDLSRVGALFGQGFTEALGAIIRLGIVLIAMLTLDWRLALASFVAIPLIFWSVLAIARRTVRTSVQVRTSTSALISALQQELGGIRVTQALDRSAITEERFQQINAHSRAANTAAIPWSEASTPVTTVLGSLSVVIVLGFGTYLVSQHLSSVGVIIAFLLYVQQFNYPLQVAANLYNTAQGTVASAARVFEILDLEETIQDKPGAAELATVEGKVEFRDVAFSYKPNHPAVQELTFTIPAGKTLAVVGASGAGKSTLVNLLARLYEVDSGAVLVDGQDVRDVTQDSLRRQMAIILQQSTLFAGTIASNIRFGRLDATDAEIEEATKAVEAHEFIMKLPRGYETPVGARGTLLSEGQRQQILFARALIRDPRILILDEATSTLDPQTEQLIQGALSRLLTDRTSLVVAHRFSTIRNADQIMVMNKGRIVERGTHDELVAAGGIYANLLAQQTGAPVLVGSAGVALREIPLFQDLPDAELARLVPSLRLEHYDADVDIVEHGAFGGDFYIIQSGSVVVVVPQAEGERVVAQLQKNDYFGEIALLGQERRTATVRTTAPSAVYILAQADFTELLEREPTVAARLNESVTARRTALAAEPLAAVASAA